MNTQNTLPRHPFPPMKDALRFVYCLSETGWKRIREAQSFRHACLLARDLQRSTGIEHCVNTR